MTIISERAQLEQLLAVYEQGSFSAAARALDCQVASVSRAVAQLEARLGVDLFARTTRKVIPTEEGHRFVQQIRPALLQIAEAEAELRNLSAEPAGKLRVDAASPFILHQLVPLMAEFRARYPRIQLELVSGEALIDLLEQRTDLAIRIGGLTDSNLHARLLGRSPLHLVASPDYLAQLGKPTTIEELNRHRLIGFADIPKLNLWHFSAGALAITPVIAASSGETVLQLCLQGHGIALLSRFMVHKALAEGALVEVLPGSLQSPHPREQVQAVYYRNTAVSSRISAFLDHIAPRLSL
ncbi:LysR family transcriptional regulator [Cellvibrio sp. ARAG 10.3]|uniref:LysR family transcriptional regulator n=1 Tax=Cellvibrio sp. ARAG 10.3 TaxID=3451358 RepID=UPI003F472D6F